jgi:hypothetical protein
MNMKNDDYLWDGTGEPDPDVERLEGLLGRYRSERPAPKMPETPVVPFRPRRAAFAPIAAVAAAAVLALTLGIVWIASRPQAPDQVAHDVRPPANINGTGKTPDRTPDVQPPPPPPTNGSEGDEKPAPGAPGRKSIRKPVKPAPAGRDETIAATQPELRAEPLVDLTTAMHIEQAETLLRSFRNVEADDESSLAEVALDTRRSRDLLEQNVILRRGARAKKNLAVGTLLTDLEPVLVDIASLGSRPSREDVRAVQQRIEQREIVADLQLYSSNRPVNGF